MVIVLMKENVDLSAFIKANIDRYSCAISNIDLIQKVGRDLRSNTNELVFVIENSKKNIDAQKRLRKAIVGK